MLPEDRTTSEASPWIARSRTKMRRIADLEKNLKILKKILLYPVRNGVHYLWASLTMHAGRKGVCIFERMFLTSAAVSPFTESRKKKEVY